MEAGSRERKMEPDMEMEGEENSNGSQRRKIPSGGVKCKSRKMGKKTKENRWEEKGGRDRKQKGNKIKPMT